MTEFTAPSDASDTSASIPAKPGPAPMPKADPETLVLRGRPARITRFRKGVIVSISAAAAALIAGVSWLALGSSGSRQGVAGEERASAATPKLPEALAGAPSGYGDTPRLGPKLPGDLGRPILKHQRETDMALSADTGGDAATRAAAAADAERQRLAAEERAARESEIMLRGGRSVASSSASGSFLSEPAGASATAADIELDPNRQRMKNDLVGRPNESDDTSPHRLQDAASPYALQAGSVIAASLITGLNSDLPGLVTAQVTENVYDSISGRTLLIPQGSRLVGSYDSVVAYGQSRALVVWQRIILPDGSSIRIDNVPASDTQGYAGLSDRIDRHTWQLLKGVGLSTLLGVATELGSGSSESDLVRAVRESAQQGGARAGDQVVARSLDIQPTLKVRPGWPLRIVVHKDVVLRPWRALGAQ
ncbi:type IV secretion system protein VirB10 [Sphingopyxis sp. YR583]|uniref:TrbI/VirB10 family protein n=1 Tax=Sphingopyxis sp. YR583 TaxID=1881047 RepID=UPI0008A74BDD|nr:TrbI/VirB10 family protein [Sphingopyxis sp. YR583]SEH19115.1 type IV secretion system protein VirB10 [Sphingopyxis sp. YR583]